ncbi:MAG TPA: hypothetical protein VGH12_00160 [Steroidobacteraceae bacterium]
MNRRRIASILLMVAAASAGGAARAEDGCVDFKWDVAGVRALFAGAAQSLSAGADPNSAPVLQPNRLYALKLPPQDRVSFAAKPGARNTLSGAFAGLATFRISQPGSYRVSIDAPFWIDVVANGALLPAKDFQGQHDCSAPHKIVEFELPGARPLVLQLSNAVQDEIRLTITPVASRQF